MSDGITFEVDKGKVLADGKFHRSSLTDYLSKSQLVRSREGARIVRATNVQNTVPPDLGNGFVGSCFTAYNMHYHLVLSPDDVWVTITTSLARYVDANAKRLRDVFVSHEGKKKLVVFGGGTFETADYDGLIDRISEKIDQNTKDDIRAWVECNFSTTTKVSRTVSKVVLMGALKNYFSYKMCLMCGLPKVTLRGTPADWAEIQQRVKRLATWNDRQLTAWSEVLSIITAEFVATAQGKPDTDFWNRIAHQTGGGSGPRYLEGWVLGLIAFDENGRYFLNKPSKILATNKFGQMDTNDVPNSAVEVPVIVDDNGTEHRTVLYAGALMSQLLGADAITPALGWALIDVSASQPPAQEPRSRNKDCVMS